MRVHSCEPDFRVICGIENCAATFRRYSAYQKHVYRTHRAIAGITPAPGRCATRNEHAGDIEQDASIPTASTSSEEALVDNEGPSGSGDFISDIREQLVLFYLKITEKLKLVFTTADEIFTVMRSLVHQILDGHNQNTLKFLMEENVASSVIENLGSRASAADIVENIFSGLGSTHLRKKYVAEHFPHTEVTEVPLQAGSCNDSVCYIPVKKLLTSFVQNEDMLECLMQPPATPSDVLSDFADGDFLGHHRQLAQDDSHTIFLLFYTDELEITNPLGSAAGRHKVLAVYFSVLNLHPRYRSKLGAIHLILLVEYCVAMRHGLDKVLAPLVGDLNLLHKHGMDARSLHFNVVTVAFTGDNLSMHRLAGLQCCFSNGRISRFCLARHKQLRQLHATSDCVERTSQMHKSHLEAFALDPLVNGPLYGISNVSPLEGLSNFDVTDQLPPDAMHDILEGGIGCVLRHVLGGLIQDRILRKQDLDRVAAFKYGFHDRKSAPNAVRDTFLTGKASLRGTASQRLCLFRLLPQFYGDSIPEDNPHWRVYLAYRHVVDIILAERIPKDCIPYLQVKVEEFLELYTAQYPNAVVTPKLHYLLHYSKYIQKFGPPRRFWGMRFEAKHSYFKSLASKVKNFRNTCLTLATRHQLLQAYELSGSLFDSPLETTGARPIKVEELPEEQQAAVAKVTLETEVSAVKTASFDNCQYRLSDVFVHKMQHDIPQFLKIEKLLVFGSFLLLLC
ncbi:uncharacterized protein LOC120849844 [Ixodes scapularis]|uniref:uncharacterized protein LOC120849844 n=1 Tax=Ixodes scapularis TaxID=6945 RepID=UPI001AD7E050|nr:uncharacterized protein LOC120849844 [Ixodes scapularis]